MGWWGWLAKLRWLFLGEAIIVRFESAQTRQHFARIAAELGKDEGQLATRLLTRFLVYMEENRPQKKEETSDPETIQCRGSGDW
jgi:hypothetical protein